MLLRAEPLAFVVHRGRTKVDMQVHPDPDRLTTILWEGDKVQATGFSGSNLPGVAGLTRAAVCYWPASFNVKEFFTDVTPGTLLAISAALSIWVGSVTAPASVTAPPFAIMFILEVATPPFESA
jgi:hypothetical protein